MKYWSDVMTAYRINGKTDSSNAPARRCQRRRLTLNPSRGSFLWWNKPTSRTLLAAGLLILALVGCSATPDEKQLEQWKNQEGPGEMKAGPGLLSDEDGAFTVYDSKKGGLLPKKGQAETAKSSAEQTAETTEAAGTAALAAAGPAASQSVKTPHKAREFQEFREFQQWQKEKEQFHEYREGRDPTHRSSDYKEFQAYRQWQKSTQDSSDFKEFQEYQQWKKSGRSSADFKEFREWSEFKAYQEWRNSQHN